MLRCSPEAFAKCPTRHICGNIQEATFTEGSECDLFNRSVADKPMTNGDWIRAMSDEDLAMVIMCPRDLGRRIDTCIGESCKDCSLQWLQQPAEDEYGGNEA